MSQPATKIAVKRQCPRCDGEFSLRGLYGHLRFKHGVDSDEAEELIATAARPSDDSETSDDQDGDGATWWRAAGLAVVLGFGGFYLVRRLKAGQQASS